VLAILATREGTSVTTIDNKRDGFRAGRTWGQRLFFNTAGRRAVLTGQRLSDFAGGRKETGPATSPEAAGREGLNMVLLIQVPLKQRQPRRGQEFFDGPSPGAAGSDAEGLAKGRSDVESAVIGHGRIEGPFTEIADLAIERDPRFPIRATVQFYKATSNGVVSEGDMREIAAQIREVHASADYVGSLVTSGPTGRPTEHDGGKIEPPRWWPEFWARHAANTGQSQDDALRLLRRLLGPRWYEHSWDELARALATGPGK
jgi:hypothetical protein